MADPNALVVAVAAAETLERVGLPEGRIPLAEAAVYVATAPKSNASYLAIDAAMEAVRRVQVKSVPPHLQDSHYSGAAELGRGRGYRYAHDYPGHFVKQQFLPDELKDRRLWEAQDNAAEQKHAERMRALWGEDKFRKS